MVPGNFEAVPVMEVLEKLDSNFKDEHKGIFTFGVDFAGSDTSQFVNSRFRHGASGLQLSGNDFDEDWLCYQDDIASKFPDYLEDLKVQLPTCSPQKRCAIEHSFWLALWRGMVMGAVTAAFMKAKPIDKPGDCWKSYLGTYSICQEGPSSRFVLAVSIDGGPITQVEKANLPGIFKTVLSNVARRGGEWGSEAHILWVHFPTCEDFFRSMDGICNLTVDMDSTRGFEYANADDSRSKQFPLTLQCNSSLSEQGEVGSLLRVSVAQCVQTRITVDEFMQKMAGQGRKGDDSGVLFSLQRMTKSGMDFPKEECLSGFFMFGLPKSAAKLIQDVGVSPEVVNEQLEQQLAQCKEECGNEDHPILQKILKCQRILRDQGLCA